MVFILNIFTHAAMAGKREEVEKRWAASNSGAHNGNNIVIDPMAAGKRKIILHNR